MKVFIANFGQENYLWPKCLERGTVATINNEDAQPFWERGDRQGHIAYALAHLKTAITGIPLQFEPDVDDVQMLYSLDRIDSSGHYARGNLQVVCRFINRWKSDGDDQEFRRILAVARSAVP